ncbi:retrovirus-related pol polyprotein from transposon TNT 1-94 [Tanacetum coccineum]
MHNNIMAAGSRDHPPMLATGRYAQWKSPVPTTDDSPAVPERTTIETILNMSPENKEHCQSEKEAIHLLLTGIGDEIYSTVNACKTSHDIFTSHDGESIESYYSRFYKMMNEMIRNNLTVATMQYQKEVNEIRAERIAKNANPLALVAAAQQYPYPYYQVPKYHISYAPPSKQSSSTRSHASTKYKGKEISKPITPQSESTSEEDSDPKQAQRDKDMQKNLALIAKYFKNIYKPTNNNLRTSSNSRNKNVDTSPRYKNENQTGKFGNQRTVTVAGARETVGSQVVQQTGIQCFNCKEFGHFAKESEKGVTLQAEQADWLENTDEGIDEQELEAHYSYMAKIQEVPTVDSETDTEPLEKTDQNAEECDDERDALANLIENLKLDIDEKKSFKIN